MSYCRFSEWELDDGIKSIKSAWQREYTARANLEKMLENAESENAKLREYAESYAKAVECEGCGWCPYDTCAMCDVETMPMRDGCKLYDELRELGIEVKE